MKLDMHIGLTKISAEFVDQFDSLSCLKIVATLWYRNSKTFLVSTLSFKMTEIWELKIIKRPPFLNKMTDQAGKRTRSRFCNTSDDVSNVVSNKWKIQQWLQQSEINFAPNHALLDSSIGCGLDYRRISK